MFNDLASLFISQFTTNKVKHLEAVDLFDIKQAKGQKSEGIPCQISLNPNANLQHPKRSQAMVLWLEQTEREDIRLMHEPMMSQSRGVLRSDSLADSTSSRYRFDQFEEID
ncbi:hypothetical protein CR513_15432, partial [Mucuna pruriens]